ncbi:hypothetical protein SAMN05216282_101286 [Cryobacterium psychrotolerans]|uniref:Uncharacterized protein n=1 Tax=Cryobacterium psychrotolerans TaxID=386301 RepID=A0A1G8XPY8_9MICO|nr:hypothetical protein [Cryobacterium psychrotolerans]SDJ91840.1 hypothetical protein SAMN05216282_101286 [Cryobacterium psychrotolerans]
MQSAPAKPSPGIAARLNGVARGFGVAGGELRRWPARRWWVALGTAAFTIVFIAIPTDLIDTPFFAREVPPTVWSWPVLLVSAVLAGLVTATYIAHPDGAAPSRAVGRLGMTGWVVTFFAVGCPVCNKLVLLALGTTGAMQFFEPVQPYLAAASIILLGWALYARLTRENSCRLPARRAADAAIPADAAVTGRTEATDRVR